MCVDISSHTQNSCCNHLLSGNYFGPLMYVIIRPFTQAQEYEHKLSFMRQEIPPYYIKNVYTMYEGKVNCRRPKNIIKEVYNKCMKKYAQQKILFRDTKWLLNNMSHRVVTIKQFEPAQ